MINASRQRNLAAWVGCGVAEALCSCLALTEAVAGNAVGFTIENTPLADVDPAAPRHESGARPSRR